LISLEEKGRQRVCRVRHARVDSDRVSGLLVAGSIPRAIGKAEELFRDKGSFSAFYEKDEKVRFCMSPRYAREPDRGRQMARHGAPEAKIRGKLWKSCRICHPVESCYSLSAFPFGKGKGQMQRGQVARVAQVEAHLSRFFLSASHARVAEGWVQVFPWPARATRQLRETRRSPAGVRRILQVQLKNRRPRTLAEIIIRAVRFLSVRPARIDPRASRWLYIYGGGEVGLVRG